MIDPKVFPPASSSTEAVDATDVVLRFLESVGHRSEAEFYLGLFRAESKESFANLVISATVLHEAAEAVVLDLRFLRGLGLVPVVTLGLSSTPTASSEQAERLHRRLERAELPAQVFAAELPNVAEQVTEAARSGVIPIVAFTSGDPSDAVPRFDTLGDLAARLKTKKLIFVSRPGGMRLRQPDAELPIINLATDYDSLVQKRALTPRRLFLLEQTRRLLVEKVTHRMFIAITSPLLLLRELFTMKGSGTLIKRGSTILRKNGFSEIDHAKMGDLLRSSFGRELDDQFFERDIHRIYVEENYRGAALVRATPEGAYLCKFAVEREAQGEGLGRDIWRVVVSDYAKLFWRARPENPIVPFYVQECDGMVRSELWHTFWRGIEPDRIPNVIATALAQPIDFQSP